MTRDDRRLLPLRPLPESDERSPRVLDLTGEDADLVFDALSSSTARRVLDSLHDDPAPPAELAERLDLSLQNVHYHLRNLRDADLIAEVGTGYSEKGVETSIYAPTAEPVVLSGADPDVRSELRRLLEGTVGVVILFGFVSVLVHWVLTSDFADETAPPRPEPTPVPGPFDPEPLVPLGIVFFAGGVTMLVLITGWWYWRGFRR